MTLVNAETGEILAACTPDEARALTDRIREAAERVWSLLLEAHERQAWAALGYSSWRDYAVSEFGMSQSRAYQLLDQARVIREIEAAAGSTMVELNERQARAVKPRLKGVTNEVRDQVDAGAEPAEAVDTAVEKAVAEERAKAEEARRKRDEDNAAIRALNEQHQPPGFDPAENEESVRQRGEFARLCRDLSKLPAPEAFIERHRSDLRERHIGYVEGAYEWLDAFLLMWRDQ